MRDDRRIRRRDGRWKVRDASAPSLRSVVAAGRFALWLPAASRVVVALANAFMCPCSAFQWLRFKISPPMFYTRPYSHARCGLKKYSTST
jgi:hypothetical protein